VFSWPLLCFRLLVPHKFSAQLSIVHIDVDVKLDSPPPSRIKIYSYWAFLSG
jgi:hypothetical protein